MSFRGAGQARRSLGVCCCPYFARCSELTRDASPRANLTLQRKRHKQSYRARTTQRRQEKQIGDSGELHPLWLLLASQRQVSEDCRNKVADADKREKVIGERGDFLEPRIDFD